MYTKVEGIAMSRKIEVMIVDDNKDYTDILCDFFAQSQTIQIMDVAHDGKEALAKVKNSPPDLILLDMIMPIYDGISLLEKLSELSMNPKPKIIVISAIAQESYIKQALALGTDYYLVKPFDLNVLESRIRRLCANEMDAPLIIKEPRKQTPSIITDLPTQIVLSLLDVGVHQHTLGYTYLKYALTLILSEHHDAYSMTKLIYPSVASKYDTSSSCVDKAMRSVILSAFNHDNMKLRSILKQYNYKDNRPSNSQFLHILTDLVNKGKNDGH